MYHLPAVCQRARLQSCLKIVNLPAFRAGRPETGSNRRPARCASQSRSRRRCSYLPKPRWQSAYSGKPRDETWAGFWSETCSRRGLWQCSRAISFGRGSVSRDLIWRTSKTCTPRKDNLRAKIFVGSGKPAAMGRRLQGGFGQFCFAKKRRRETKPNRLFISLAFVRDCPILDTAWTPRVRMFIKAEKNR